MAKVTWNVQSLSTSTNKVLCTGAFRVLLQNRGTNRLYYKKESDNQFIAYIPGKPEDSTTWLEMIKDAGHPDNYFEEDWVIKFEGDGTNEAFAIIDFLVDDQEPTSTPDLQENLPKRR